MISKLGSVSRSGSFDSINKVYKLTEDELSQVKKHFLEEKKRQRRKHKKNMNDQREKYFLQYLDMYKPELSVNLTDTAHDENSNEGNSRVDPPGVAIYNKFNQVSKGKKKEWKSRN